MDSYFNTGVDKSIALFDPNGVQIDIGKYAEFNSKPEQSITEIKPTNTGGVIYRKPHYHGWTGTLSVYREDGRWDRLQAVLENNYHQGIPSDLYSIHESVQNTDGSVDEAQYLNCTLTIEDAGTWKEDAEVMYKINVYAERKVINGITQ